MTKDSLHTVHNQPRPRRQMVGFLSALVVLAVVLAMPNDVSRLSIGAFAKLPLELPALLLILAMLPRWLARPVAVLAGLALSVLLAIKIGDMAAYEALARPFNPILDFHLIDAAWTLTSAAIGTPAAMAVVIGIVVGLLLLSAVMIACAVHAAGTAHSYRRLVVISATVALGFGLAALSTVAPPAVGARVTTFSTDLAKRHIETVAASLDDLETFQTAALEDPVARIEETALLDALDGRDVLLLFVESYGRTVLDNPLYASSVRPSLEAFDAVVERRGLSAASGFLTSPIAGGQSWLGHASLLSGLWVDNQRRYNALLASDRQTLIGDFSRAGFRTAALMPAITMAWPEGTALGYDAIYDEKRLGYRGLPFNWVTMPDQYTMAALDRLELDRDGRDRPVFAEVALISSHAPWTPIPELVDWARVGDGRIFNDQASSGPTPREVWSDDDRVRLHFRRSIEYAVENLASYVENRLRDDTVMVIVGDHQPARLITGPTDNRDVLLHIIADDSALVSDLSEALDLEAGMIPGDERQAERMSVFRARFVEALSGADAGSRGAPDGMEIPGGPI